MYNLKWWKQGSSIQNFGDYLGAYMGSYFPDISYKKNAKYVLRNVGSVIADVVIAKDTSDSQEHVVYFGCGARGSKLKPNLIHKCYFHTVRGPLTRDLIGLPDDTVLGDSAFMLSGLYTPSNIGPQGNLLVTHFNETREDEELLKMTGCDAVLSTRIENNFSAVEQVIDKIANANFIFTSSLHGAIVASVYNVPFAYWSSSEINVPFKWKDFSLSIGLDTEFNETMADGVEWYEAQCFKLDIPSSVKLIEKYKELASLKL